MPSARSTATQQNNKARESRIRRLARRQGYLLVKSRRRDPNAWDCGTYMLLDAGTNGAILQNTDLGDVEEWLSLSR
jgi:hypothetical protein